jgi:hypothetical protein
MASLGKINLSEVCPEHPFAGHCIILGVQKPKNSETLGSESLKKKAPDPTGKIAAPRTVRDAEEGLKRAGAERDAEWEEVRKKYPIRPTDLPEVQEEMRRAQNNAMLDP